MALLIFTRNATGQLSGRVFECARVGLGRDYKESHTCPERMERFQARRVINGNLRDSGAGSSSGSIEPAAVTNSYLGRRNKSSPAKLEGSSCSKAVAVATSKSTLERNFFSLLPTSCRGQALVLAGGLRFVVAISGDREDAHLSGRL